MAFFACLLHGLAIRRKFRNFATELLPALHSNIDILAIDIDAVADTLAQMATIGTVTGVSEGRDKTTSSWPWCESVPLVRTKKPLRQPAPESPVFAPLRLTCFGCNRAMNLMTTCSSTGDHDALHHRHAVWALQRKTLKGPTLTAFIKPRLGGAFSTRFISGQPTKSMGLTGDISQASQRPTRVPTQPLADIVSVIRNNDGEH